MAPNQFSRMDGREFRRLRGLLRQAAGYPKNAEIDVYVGAGGFAPQFCLEYERRHPFFAETDVSADIGRHGCRPVPGFIVVGVQWLDKYIILRDEDRAISKLA